MDSSELQRDQGALPRPLPPTAHIASSLLGWFLSMAVELASCFTSLTFWGLYCKFGFIFTASFFILSGHPWRNLTLSYIAWLYHLSGNVTQASMTLSLPLYCNFDACKTSTMWLMLPSSFANLRVWYYTLLGLRLQQPLLVLTLGQLHWAVAFQVQETLWIVYSVQALSFQMNVQLSQVRAFNWWIPF